MATKPKVGQITATKPRFEYVDVDRSQLTGARFYDDTPAPSETTAPERTWGQALGDTAVQLAEGVNTTLGAVPSIVAPEGAMAGFFRGNAEHWRDKQSDVLKERIAGTDQRIQEAGKDGVMSQIGTAVSEYWNDPAQAARLVATNLPSMAATLGTGAAAGIAAKGVAAARGMDAAGKAALAAKYGTTTAAATNAALNAGGARGEAFEDLQQTALAQGMSPEQAEQAGVSGSILPGVVGGVAGAISGKMGLEKALLGQATTGAATRKAAGAFGAELAGEQIEELAPKVTTNYQVGHLDAGRGLTDDLGRTIVETAIGSGPGAVVAGGAAVMRTPAQEAADAIRATETLPESGPMTRATNAATEAKAQAVEAGAPLVDEQAAAEPVPEPVDDPVRDQILALPDGARQDALRAYAVVNRTDVAKGVQQYNRKLLDRLLAENAPPPVLGERLTDTDMGAMLGGGGMTGNADPLMGALGMNREAQANSISNVARAAENRPPMPASDAARMLDEARNQGVDLDVTEHPAGGFVLVPPNWVTPDMAAQGEARLNETIARMQQADAAPVERAPRTRTEPVDLSLSTDPVQNYMDTLRTVNTPANVQQRMVTEQGKTPDQRIAQAASEAPAQADPVADRLRQAVSQAATPAPTDILNPAGEPFKTRMAADRAAKQTPGAVVPVEGGFVVRPQEPVNVQDVPQAPEVPQAAPAISQPSQAPQAVGAQTAGPAVGVPAEGAGAVEAAGVIPESQQKEPETQTEQAPEATESVAQSPVQPLAQQQSAPVGDEQPFAPETGTLGIPRAEMPQVPTQSHGGLVKHLNAQGIEHETTMVDAAGLKPTQAEFSPSKVEKAKEATGDRAVIVSSDGHIIDGHHQALAAAEEGKPVKAIVLDAPVEQALEAVKNSPSAQPQVAADAPVAKPLSRADVTAARQQAATAITERIDAMTAQEVQKIAARFLPTMGVKVPAGKARIKTAMTDPKVNLQAAAAEVGAALADDVKRALQADMEGRVGDAGATKNGATTAETEKDTDESAVDSTPTEDARQKIGAARKAQEDGAKEREAAKTAKRRAERAKDSTETGLRVGIAPGSADPVTVRDGTVYVGKYEAVNYDTGEPVTVPKGSTGEAVAQALKDAGALSSRQRLFGLGEMGDAVMFSRSPATQSTYEARIDALFAESAKASREGVRVLDSSDVMGLLGHERVPLVLSETHVIHDGRTNHPEMTAAAWKQVPEWIENPAAVYTDPKHPGKLTIVAPVRLAGYPVLIAVEPNTLRGKPDHLLVTAFAKTTGELPAHGYLASSGRLLYADTKKAPDVWRLIGDNPRPNRPAPGAGRILTEKQLGGYRRANTPAAFMGQPAQSSDSNARTAATQKLVDGIKAKWTSAPEIIVARNMQDAQIPQAVREYDQTLKSQGATGEPRGFIYKGKVYLLSDQLKGPQQIAEVLFHEVLGHYGLRGAFGDALTPILKQIAALRRADVQAKAKEYGLDMSKEADRLQAAEEVLTEMAQTTPELGYVKRAIAAIRNWLRAHVPGFKNLALTDADVIQAYILPARGFVTRSKETGAQSLERAMAAFSRTPVDQTQTEAFKKWFGDSKVVDAQTGKPLVVYHGSGSAFDAFDANRLGSNTGYGDAEIGFHFADNRADADFYATMAAEKTGQEGVVRAFYLSMQNPLVVGTDEADGNAGEQTQDFLDDKNLAKEYAVSNGHDGIIYLHGTNVDSGYTAIAFRPEQIKSAIGNNGNFDPVDPDIRFSRTTAQSIASSMGDMTPDQEKAYKNVAGVKAVPTVRERMDALKANLGLKLRQGLVDQFAAIKQLDQNAYVQARMSKGTDGTLEAMLMYGKPFMRDGAPDVDVKDGGFAKVLASLKGEQDRWMMWIAAQRAEKLKAEGKENLMTDDDISALKTLNAGKMADGTARMPIYDKALAELNEYNDAMLKLAMDSGLIDQAAYDLMAGQPYVPFYRLMEDGDMKGPKFSSGLTNQKAWQKLKGGTQQLNADLLQNMLLNWSHLLQASAKNRAATATMDAAEKMAVAYKVAADTKGAVKVMRDGSAEHWMVEDPYLLDAISAIHYVPSPLMKPLAKFKQLLTWGVTVNPTFKIRNLIRDSVSAIAQSEVGYNPGANVAKGWKLTAKDSQIYASMLASGGLIKFGTQENTDRLRAQVAKLGGVVLDKSGAERFFGQIKDLYDVYNEFGDRAENVNRAALYDALIKKGKTHAEAAFMARDLMDFSMGGSAPVVRFLTQTVPFLNARLVGLDKLGRAAMEDPRRFAAVTGAVALASLALLAAYSDDDDWKKREDWDRDAYWWFKIGGQAYRIPKPFEVGAIGTLAERTAELMLSDEMTGKRYMERVSHMLSGTFSFNPVPQAFKPLLDLYANKDSFTGRAIESQADQRLRPQDRYSERTPEVAKFLGGLGLPDPAQLVKGEYSALSPKQVEHLIRGYFSWVGTAAMTVSDFGLRPLAGRGERPDMRLKDVFIAGNFVENLPTGSSRYVTQMYEQSRQVEQAYASYQEAIKAGDTEKAQSIKESAGPLLRNRPAYTAATRKLAEINRTAKRIEADQAMAGAAKRARLTQLEQQRQVIAQRVSRLAAATP